MPNPPKHPDERHGHRTAAENAYDEVSRGQVVQWHPADPDWDPIVIRWYESLAVSGQAVDYQQSDAATAYVMAENLDRCMSYVDVHGNVVKTPVNGQQMASFLAGNGDLLATAGQRRRVKLEIERPGQSEQQTAESAAVTSLVGRKRRGPA